MKILLSLSIAFAIVLNSILISAYSAFFNGLVDPSDIVIMTGFTVFATFSAVKLLLHYLANKNKV